MKAYLRYEGISKLQYPQSPLQVESKQLFTLMPRRKTAQATFGKSLHNNKSPTNFDRQFVLEELRLTNASLQEVNKELQQLNESLQEQVQKLQESNKALQLQINQMTNQIDDLKINNRHLRSQDSSLHLHSKTFDQRLQDQNNHIGYLQLQLKKLNDQLEQKRTLESKPMKMQQQALREFDSICLEMKNYIVCKLCHQELKEPVTVIPCAHSYCRSCQKGYMGRCFICGPEEEIEATYANLLLIPMIELFKKICEIRELLK
ncbi:unnamed protein product (macronuclear) [Paramecium tetraurelia]|uniref:RING-type domain-containing protein n=1 Tax=Paramecium tetraurelia TaxID=5888 RepID=A0CZW9_PARTE|nr:uncharacterized protein GSPATT00011909001 [Paramecium tetraurelia]CAK76336.1 unnamed protein product [Paramecium tetraurelia]|eukprot:XP_001443733.1 hypothetical protein (macronuclear) [Paramecium tetraurelia strain d4-2]